MTMAKINDCKNRAFDLGYNHGLSNDNSSINNALAILFNDDANMIKKCRTSYLQGFSMGSKTAQNLLLLKKFTTTEGLLKTRKGEKELLGIIPISDKFVFGIFQGQISPLDIIVKYWKYDPNKDSWGFPKQPKHIHWVVDIMIKQEFSPRVIKTFVKSIESDWDEMRIVKIQTVAERDKFLNPKRIYHHLFTELQKYSTLPVRGEYPMEFLIVLSELLMTQERTNMNNAFMFRNLLNRFEKNDFYGIINTASMKKTKK